MTFPPEKESIPHIFRGVTILTSWLLGLRTLRTNEHICLVIFGSVHQELHG